MYFNIISLDHLAKYVKTRGLFTILLKSTLHCLQLIVMHNWTKEYLD